MFSFFHRTSKIHLDCFINNRYVYENVPIVHSYKTYPDWWLDLPNSVRTFDYNILDKQNTELNSINDYIQKDNNMKNCYGFREFYKRGSTIESWSDLRFKVGLVGYKFFSSNSPVTEHPESQRGKGFNNFHHAKLANPWLFRVKEDVKFLFMAATWNMENYDFVIPPGVLNFNLVNVAHINILIPKKSYEFEIPAGQPLVHIIPLSDRKLKITNHLLTEEEYVKMITVVGPSFYGWRRKFDLMTRNKKRENIKCPFH